MQEHLTPFQFAFVTGCLALAASIILVAGGAWLYARLRARQMLRALYWSHLLSEPPRHEGLDGLTVREMVRLTGIRRRVVELFYETLLEHGHARWENPERAPNDQRLALTEAGRSAARTWC